MSFQELQQKIVAAGKKAFPAIRAQHPDEQFYFFGLYTSGSYSYVTPTCSTYQGLKEVVEAYQTEAYFAAMPKDELVKSLKWSPCDSPLHTEGEDYFEELDAELLFIDEELDRLYSGKPDEKEVDAFVHQIENCLIQAMKELDAAGVFGTPEERAQVTLGIMMGDQSTEDRIRFVKALNPPDLAEQFVLDQAEF